MCLCCRWAGAWTPKSRWLLLLPRVEALRLILIGERFFPNFPKCGNNWRYVSIYGGVLSLFVKFSRSKNIKFVTIPIFGKKTPGKYGRLKNCAKKMSKICKKSSPIRMTLIVGTNPTTQKHFQGRTTSRHFSPPVCKVGAVVVALNFSETPWSLQSSDIPNPKN